MARHKIQNEMSWPAIAEELPLVIPAADQPNPAHELQRLLAARLGQADGSTVTLPEPSRVAAAVETIASGASRVAGPLLMVVACAGILVALL